MTTQTDKIVSILVEEQEDDFLDVSHKDVEGSPKFREIADLLESGFLTIHASVKRTDHRYVHQYTTEVSLEPDFNWESYEDQDNNRKFEDRICEEVTELEKQIKEDMVDWNHKIYKELEDAYFDSVSDEVVAENIRINEYEFNENGRRDDGSGLTYDDLDEDGQEKAREWWVRVHDEMGDNSFAEPTILEWKWLLKNKGFSGIEIGYSGFGSQGDGASFTAKDINLKTYILAPDPLSIPEQDREQLEESQEEDDPLEDEAKEVYGTEHVRRESLGAIRTPADYFDYEQRVLEFLNENGIHDVSAVIDEHGGPVTDSFSSRPCECCKRFLAGSRINVAAYRPVTKEILNFWICLDCEYYLEYGQLDDQTMMDIEKNSGIEEAQENSEDDFDMKEITDMSPRADEHTFTIHSSSGELRAFRSDGRVISVDLRGDAENHGDLERITQFDVVEWRKKYGKEIPAGADIDILDLGYWTAEGHYEPPAPGWREEFGADFGGPDVAKQRGERRNNN